VAETIQPPSSRQNSRCFLGDCPGVGRAVDVPVAPRCPRRTGFCLLAGTGGFTWPGRVARTQNRVNQLKESPMKDPDMKKLRPKARLGCSCGSRKRFPAASQTLNADKSNAAFVAVHRLFLNSRTPAAELKLTKIEFELNRHNSANDPSFPCNATCFRACLFHCPPAEEGARI
jgi:hypothetical protein